MRASVAVYRAAAVVLAASVFIPCLAGGVGPLLNLMGIPAQNLSANFWDADRNYAGAILGIVTVSLAVGVCLPRRGDAALAIVAALAALVIVGLRFKYFSNSFAPQNPNVPIFGMGGIGPAFEPQVGWLFMFGSGLLMAVAAAIALIPDRAAEPAAASPPSLPAS